jgi:DNA invertase Pin-like site-specific DNA recombinase
VSTRGEMGHVILTVLGMVAQMERRFIKQRQRDGIERAKATGSYAGGVRKLNYSAIIKLGRNGASVSSLAAKFNCSRMQIYRILKSET